MNQTVTLHLKVRARRLGLNNQKKKHITLHGTWLSFKYPTPVSVKEDKQMVFLSAVCLQ